MSKLTPTNPGSPESPARPEPIAIIGIGCRYPGGIHDLESFWHIVKNGIDAISEMPPDRFDQDTFYDPTPAVPGKVVTRQGGFLSDQLDYFDAAFFGISPREATMMDPQQRLLLETAWEAIEDAGLSQPQITGSRTGVYIGMWTNEYQDRIFQASNDIDLYSTTGSGRYAASGRISYVFDLQGPSLTIDTACSSSLVATHLACQSLRRGETEMAFVGAANLILVPQISIGYSRSKMLSPDARCKFGDASANGYVRSEGVGMMVLKPLARALADGNPIHAIILGSAANNDGHSSGLLVAPSGKGQANMLRAAYRDAGILPGQVGYVEAHGTGTPAGDPVELEALGDVLREGRAPDNRCAVGSIKTNFGHAEAASGLAGLIKTVLCLKHRTIPPNLHFKVPNPNIPWDDMPIYLPSELEPWPAGDQPLLAGVNSFGITGTNAHIILQEAPRVDVPSHTALFSTLPLSARSPEALKALSGNFADLLLNTDSTLSDILYTASRHRFHHDHRLAVSADTKSAMADALKAYAENDPLSAVTNGQVEGERKVVFVFPGQGSQWLGMGRQLYQAEPVFQKIIQRCEEAFRPFVDWSLIGQINATESQSRLTEINVIQPTLFAIEVALAETWRSWGIEPDAVVGHSMGEPAAAFIAGALSLEDAARVICTRSRLMKRVSGKGGMAVVDLTPDQAIAALVGFEDSLSVAVVNGPHTTVISGDQSALEKVTAQFESQGVFVRPVKVDVAAHSPHMDAIQPILVEELAGIQPHEPSIPIYSTVTGKRVDLPLDAVYWGRNLRQPVMFATAVNQINADGYTIFIECSPHPILLAAIEQNAPTDPSSGKYVTIPSMRRGESELHMLNQGLEQFYCAGGSILWERSYPLGRCVRLPAYPWQRERFWAKEAELGANTITRPSLRLLNTYFETPDRPGAKTWQTTLSLETFPYLADHRVGEAILLPAAAFIEMLLETSSSFDPPLMIEDLEINEALTLQPGVNYVVQVSLDPDYSFTIVSHKEDDPDWIEHARGSLRQQPAITPTPVPLPVEELDASEDHPGSDHVAAMHTRSLYYGPAFQTVTSFRHELTKILAHLRLPAALSAGDHVIHPSMLDACFQLLIGTLDISSAAGDAFLPVKIANCKVFARPRGSVPLNVTVVRTSGETDDLLRGDIQLHDDQGNTILSIDGLEMSRFKSNLHSVDDLLFAVQWNQTPNLPDPTSADGRWLILSDQPSSAASLCTKLQSLNASCSIVQIAASQDSPNFSLSDPNNPIDLHEPLRSVVYLAADLSNDPADSATTHAKDLLGLVQHLGRIEWKESPRLWIVTQGAQAVTDGESVSPALNALWGLAATIAHEFPEWRTTRVDLDSKTSMAVLCRELIGGQTDPVSLRGEQRFTAHLHPETLSDQNVSSVEQASQNDGRPFQVEITHPGSLDSIELRACLPPHPAPGQVVIEVHSAGINFIDVMKAMGIYPGVDPQAPVWLGLECAGTVIAIGDNVDPLERKFTIGQEVLAFAPQSFGKMVVADAHLVVPKPSSLSFDQAAALPVVYLTAYYALCALGRMRRGERVLIHSAAGGVGLAAVQLAKNVGAEIFATAGSEEKRAYLRSLGIQHILDSRSLDFADQIMAITSGTGVDLVLNSLTGEAITKSLEILAPYGRFLEIGKRDIYQNTRIGLLPFQKNLSYFAIDLDRIGRERPEFLGEILTELMVLLEHGSISPLPITVYPVTQTAEAIRHISQPNHIGKIILNMAETKVKILPSRQETAVVKAAATYLITGGLGALGLAVAGWLAGQGARNLALIGRSGEEHLSEDAKTSLADLREMGVNVAIIPADIAQCDQAAMAIAHIRENMPILRGVIHAAGVLDDGILSQMSLDRLNKVFAPKISGAWNLHLLTKDEPLDFFVLFSSVTSVLGSPGQGNYAAANAFLDGLAFYRQSLGLKALSINWGPWSQIGLAAQRLQGGLQGLSGLSPLTPEVGLEVFGKMLEAKGCQMIVSGLNAGEWTKTHPAASRSTLFTELETAPSGPESASTNIIRSGLLAAESGRPRYALLEGFVQEQAALVLRLPTARVDLHKPLRTLGMDSLMSIEFRNRLESGLDVTLSATLVWNYPTVNDLVPLLADKMEIQLDNSNEPAQIEATPPVTPDLEAMASPELDDISDEDLASMLDQELDKIDDLL